MMPLDRTQDKRIIKGNTVSYKNGITTLFEIIKYLSETDKTLNAMKCEMIGNME